MVEIMGAKLGNGCCIHGNDIPIHTIVEVVEGDNDIDTGTYLYRIFDDVLDLNTNLSYTRTAIRHIKVRILSNDEFISVTIRNGR